MQPAKPIKPGCKAVVIRGHSIGTVLYVGNYLGDAPPFKSRERRIWQVDRPVIWVEIAPEGHEAKKLKKKLAPEHALMRIDDNDNERQFREEQRKDRPTEVV